VKREVGLAHQSPVAPFFAFCGGPAPGLRAAPARCSVRRRIRLEIAEPLCAVCGGRRPAHLLPRGTRVPGRRSTKRALGARTQTAMNRALKLALFLATNALEPLVLWGKARRRAASTNPPYGAHPTSRLGLTVGVSCSALNRPARLFSAGPIEQAPLPPSAGFRPPARLPMPWAAQNLPAPLSPAGPNVPRITIYIATACEPSCASSRICGPRFRSTPGPGDRRCYRSPRGPHHALWVRRRQLRRATFAVRGLRCSSSAPPTESRDEMSANNVAGASRPTTLPPRLLPL